MLTDVQVKQAKPEEKPYKKADRNRLHLFVSPSGHKSWRFKYRMDGKEGRIVFGSYPAMSLAEARELLDETRKQLRQGIDPNVLKARARLGVASTERRTFESVAREWHVPHGWRSSFSTLMNARSERQHPGADRLIIDRLIVDLMLAHMPADLSETELRYNRAGYMERRRELAVVWASMIMDGAADLDTILESPRRRLR